MKKARIGVLNWFDDGSHVENERKTIINMMDNSSYRYPPLYSIINSSNLC